MDWSIIERVISPIVTTIGGLVVTSIIGLVANWVLTQKWEYGVIIILIILIAYVFFSPFAILGIFRIYREASHDRGAPLIKHLIEEAKTSFDFVGISARTLVVEPEVENVIERKAQQGVKFRFLIMDPNSPNIAIRANDEPGQTPTAFSNDILATIARLEKLQQRLGSDRVNFEKYKIYPIWRAIFIDDRVVYASPYLRGFVGTLSPQVVIFKRFKSYYEPLKRYFDELWEGKI